MSDDASLNPLTEEQSSEQELAFHLTLRAKIHFLFATGARRLAQNIPCAQRPLSLDHFENEYQPSESIWELTAVVQLMLFVDTVASHVNALPAVELGERHQPAVIAPADGLWYDTSPSCPPNPCQSQQKLAII